VNKQERRAARRAEAIAVFDKLLAMTRETRDNEWLWSLTVGVDGALFVASRKEFEHDDELQRKSREAHAHYSYLTSDWPNVTASSGQAPTAATDPAGGPTPGRLYRAPRKILGVGLCQEQQMKKAMMFAWDAWPWAGPLAGICLLATLGFPERWLAIPAVVLLYAELMLRAWVAKRHKC
jgi:hypothetical protein